MKATGADGVAVALKIGSDIICKASVGAAPAVGAKVEGASTWSARCIREGKPISFSHSGEGPNGSYSAILAPLLHAGRAIGCCAAFATHENAFTPAHVRALVDIAASAVHSVNPQSQPAAPEPAAADRPPALSSDVLKQLESEIDEFASFEKRRARQMIAVKSALATVLALGVIGAMIPDQVQSWMRPILYRFHHSIQESAPSYAPAAAHPTYSAKN